MGSDNDLSSEGRSERQFRWTWLIGSACFMVLLLGILLPRVSNQPRRWGAETKILPKDPARVDSPGFSRDTKPDTKRTAEEIVADKVNQFAKDRRRIAHAMAKRFKVEDLPPEVDQFFEAVAAGRWTEHCALFDKIKELRDSGQHDGLRTIFGTILEAQLVAECAHGWPAQKLLDYGESILGSLQPGMVYVGGTDPGRGIPTLLNETSEGDRHIILTQNGLADGTYLQ